jgi:hypothetical protein
MQRFVGTLKRELQLAVRIFREPAPHLLPYELALAFNATQPIEHRVPLPESGGVRAMVAFSTTVFQSQVESLLAREDAGRFASVDRKADLIRLGESTIPNAGEGLFASGQISAGEVVSIYPGTLYPPRNFYGGKGNDTNGGVSPFLDVSEIYDEEEEKNFLRPPADSAFVLARPGGFKIDGSTVAKGSALQKLLSKRTMWALGHKIQHPPRQDVEPNVVEVPISYKICLRPEEEGVAMARREKEKAEKEEKRKAERKRLIRSSLLLAAPLNSKDEAPSKSKPAFEADEEGTPEAFSPTAHTLSREQHPYDGVRIDWAQRHRVPHWMAPFNTSDSTPIPHQILKDEHFQRHLSYVSVGKRLGTLTASILVGDGGTEPPDLVPAANDSALGRLLDEQRQMGLKIPPFVVIPGVVMVACRHIEKEEELFLDYGFSGEVPAWYKEVPTATIKRILKRAKQLRIAAEEAAAKMK